MTPDPDTIARLLHRAAEARRHAYVPYSGFPVGAALLTGGGEVVTGCNVENAAYGLTLCAERVALFKAVSKGMRDLRGIAVVGPEDDRPCAPCGSCRQVLHEFNPDMPVITPTPDGFETRTVRELLPGAFEAERMREGGAP